MVDLSKAQQKISKEEEEEEEEEVQVGVFVYWMRTFTWTHPPPLSNSDQGAWYRERRCARSSRGRRRRRLFRPMVDGRLDWIGP